MKPFLAILLEDCLLSNINHQLEMLYTSLFVSVKPLIDRTNLQYAIVKVNLSIALDVNIQGEPPPVAVCCNETLKLNFSKT